MILPTRALAIDSARAEIADDGDGATIYACQGPPRCDVRDPAPEAMRHCLWCEKITIDPDGSERVEKPVEA